MGGFTAFRPEGPIDPQNPGGTAPDPDAVTLDTVVWVADQDYVLNPPSPLLGVPSTAIPAGRAFTYGMILAAFPQVGLPPPDPITGKIPLTKGELQRENVSGILGNLLSPISGIFPEDTPILGPADTPGGGGFGGVSATFTKPDRRLVNEAVKARLVALVGKADNANVDRLVDLYMSEAKRGFDLRGKQQVDPMASVDAEIEKMSEFKAIHRLRPDSVDKFDWIGSRQGAMLRAGVSEDLASELAISSATAGATESDAAKAGEFATFQRNREVLPGFFQNMQNATRNALRVL